MILNDLAANEILAHHSMNVVAHESVLSFANAD